MVPNSQPRQGAATEGKPEEPVKRPPRGTAKTIRYVPIVSASRAGVSYVKTRVVPKFTATARQAHNPDRDERRAAERALGRRLSGRQWRRLRGIDRQVAALVRHFGVENVVSTYDAEAGRPVPAHRSGGRTLLGSLSPEQREAALAPTEGPEVSGDPNGPRARPIRPHTPGGL